jgi:hypothetical protein
MAQGIDQQRRTAAAVGIGRAPDVPPEPAVRLVTDELGQDLGAPWRSGARPDRRESSAPRRCQGRTDERRSSMPSSFEIRPGLPPRPCARRFRLRLASPTSAAAPAPVALVRVDVLPALPAAFRCWSFGGPSAVTAYVALAPSPSSSATACDDRAEGRSADPVPLQCWQLLAAAGGRNTPGAAGIGRTIGWPFAYGWPLTARFGRARHRRDPPSRATYHPNDAPSVSRRVGASAPCRPPPLSRWTRPVSCPGARDEEVGGALRYPVLRRAPWSHPRVVRSTASVRFHSSSPVWARARHHGHPELRGGPCVVAVTVPRLTTSG